MKHLGLVVLLPLALLRAGCSQSPSAPSSPTSPTPSPMGRPNATALENLPLVRTLERATGRGGLLIGILGISAQEGTAPAGGGWDYVFAQVLGSGRLPLSYDWLVYADGTIKFTDNVADVGSRAYVEIGPSLVLDSPEAIRRGREYGAQAFVDRYPSALVEMGARSVGGRVIWEMRFFDLSPGHPLCNEVRVVIDASTGDLLLRDLHCLETTP